MTDKVVELRASHLESPEAIFDAAKDQWRQLVTAVPTDYFVREDSPWLAEYSLAVVLSQLTGSEMSAGAILPGGKTSPWVTAFNHQSATLLMLANRLGLTPMARFYRTKKAELLKATPTFERGTLMARFDAIETRLREQELALQVIEGLNAGIEATRADLEKLVCDLLGEESE